MSMQLGFGAQPFIGPDGLPWISVGIQSGTLSCSVGFPVGNAEEFVSGLAATVTEAVSAARAMSNGHNLILPPDSGSLLVPKQN